MRLTRARAERAVRRPTALKQVDLARQIWGQGRGMATSLFLELHPIGCGMACRAACLDSAGLVNGAPIQQQLLCLRRTHRAESGRAELSLEHNHPRHSGRRTHSGPAYTPVNKAHAAGVTRVHQVEDCDCSGRQRHLEAPDWSPEWSCRHLGAR